MLADFLSHRGFREVRDLRDGRGQTIIATDPSGEQLTMRVQLCWNRDTESGSIRAKTYSAVQLMDRIRDNDWEGTLRGKVDRQRSRGVTHFLFVQREDQQIIYAALVPISKLLLIWLAQRDTSVRLIDQGQLGRRKKSHAMKGLSPTLYLQDDRAPEVAMELWNHPGVRDLAKLPTVRVWLHDEDADHVESNDDYTNYTPQEGDRRELVDRQIRERRGQQRFRDLLRNRYGNRCLVTGCETLAVLEAAHIKPYRGEDDNHPENGLLLRADIHTLFDLDLLGIEPDGLRVDLHPTLIKEYGEFIGKSLGFSDGCRPSREALKLRFEEFQRRARRPE
jgi:hypothetical protein